MEDAYAQFTGANESPASVADDGKTADGNLCITLGSTHPGHCKCFDDGDQAVDFCHLTVSNAARGLMAA
jgi:hypothetical protein